MSLVVEGYTKRFGGLVAVQDVGFTAGPGQITAVIGPNGAGKTTLLNMISGVTAPDSGRRVILGEDASSLRPRQLAARGLARTYQSPQMFDGMSVLETAMVGAHLTGRLGFAGAVLRPFRARREEREIEDRAAAALARAGMSSALFSREAGELSYGEQRRVEIARALAGGARLLLLDEPAAGLNPSETRELAALVQGLAAEGMTVVLVEHDMDMVMTISDHIVVMNFGRKICEGTPAAVQNDRAVQEAYLGAGETDDADG